VWTHPLFDEPFTRREAWLWLVSQASHKPHRMHAGVALWRGDLACSQRDMARAWGWTRAKVRRFLALLERERMIEIPTRFVPGVPGPPLDVITICNYARFQDADAATGPQ